MAGKREKDEVKDHWLDNIDWVKVNSQTASKQQKDEDDMDVTETLNIFNPIQIYREILSIISPHETVCYYVTYIIFVLYIIFYNYVYCKRY